MAMSDLVAYVAIGAGVAGILTFLVGVLPSRKLAKPQAVIQYFQQGDTKEFIECRHRVYAAGKDSIDPSDAAYLCSFFHFWGLMVKGGLLPIWVFDSSSGERAVQLYRKLSQFVRDARHTAPRCAEYFEWLGEEIARKGYVPPETLWQK
jgi:hypothetical protein